MLKGQTALVTGASRGIGKAVALELGRLGATVVGTATTAEGAEKISAYLTEAGVSGKGAMLEVRDQAQVDALIGEIDKAHGAVTILVNNAGITRDNLAMRMKDDEWDAVIDTNLKAVFRMSKAGHARHDEGPWRPHHQHHLGGRAAPATRVRPTTAPPRPGWPA
jgi:3-oxoacyl-[acyl-carrier protein] reductase